MKKEIKKTLNSNKSIKDHIKDFFVASAYRFINLGRDTWKEYQLNFKNLKYNLSWITNKNIHSEILTIAMTKKCNLECTYCWDTGNRDNLSELNSEEIIKALDSAWKMGVRKFNPFGGEPFIRNDMFDILKYAFKKGFEITLTTNGTLISEKKCIEIVNHVPEGEKRKFVILVSLDGSNQIENDYIRGKNSFRKTIEFLEILTRERKAQKKNFGIIINTVVSRNNFKSMKNMVELCRQIGADNIHFITPTISISSRMHMSEMVRRDLVIMPEEFDTLDEHINEVIDIRHTSDGSKFILKKTV